MSDTLSGFQPWNWKPRTSESAVIIIPLFKTWSSMGSDCVSLLLSSSPVSAPEVPLQPPNSRHLPLCEQQRPPQHSDAPAAADRLWCQGGSSAPKTAPPAATGRKCCPDESCSYPYKIKRLPWNIENHSGEGSSQIQSTNTPHCKNTLLQVNPALKMVRV